MRRKNVKLEWYVIEYDFNRNEIYYENVFMDRIVEELIKELVKKHITNYEELKDKLTREFRYYYMSKAEHELIVGDLFAKDADDFYKIDVWYQLEPNMDRICEYVIRELKLDPEVFKK